MNNSKEVSIVGIDLGKNVFHLFGVNSHGKPILKKKLKRSDFLNFIAQLPACLIGMEACGGSNYWHRQISQLGHCVKLMSPQFVKPYVKGNKNDFNDAQGICEAVSRPTMRFVEAKSVEQQDMQALHRIRQSLVKSRTALSNQLRGLLLEYGIVIGKGHAQTRHRVAEILSDLENGLSERFRGWMIKQLESFYDLDSQIKAYENDIKKMSQQDDRSRRLESIPGIGPISASAIVASIGSAKHFCDARQLAASFGLVPRQHSTGGKAVLLGISKRGDKYIRTLLIHGARAVIYHLGSKDDKRSCWLRRLVQRRGVNRATVALANKNARVIWALLTRNEQYQVAL